MAVGLFSMQTLGGPWGLVILKFLSSGRLIGVKGARPCGDSRGYVVVVLLEGEFCSF